MKLYMFRTDRLSIIRSLFAYIFYVIHNNYKTHDIKYYNLMVLGYMFRPHFGHLQAKHVAETCSQEPLSCSTQYCEFHYCCI